MKKKWIKYWVLIGLLSSCKKSDEGYNNSEPLLIGNWSLVSNNNPLLQFEIKDLKGGSAPLTIVKTDDSLIVIYLPKINQHFKFESVDEHWLTLAKKDTQFVYKRLPLP